MRHMIADAGLLPDDVKMVPASPDPAALVSGQIDGYCGYVTNQGVMLETRGVKIYALNAQDLGIPETTGTIYAREDFLKGNKDVVVNFLKGAIQGWRWALDNPEPTAKLMVDKYGAPGLNYDAQLTEIKASKPYIDADAAQTKGLLAVDVALYGRIIDVYRKAGLVKSAMTRTSSAIRLSSTLRSTPDAMLETRVSRDIQVRDVTMVYHGRGDSVIALERVNMHVPTGQFASIIGPSGCGKSTCCG